MHGKYVSSNDTNNYTAYGTRTGFLYKKTISDDAINYALNEHLQQVVSLPEEKSVDIDKSYYIYGINNITLSTINYKTFIDVVRTADPNDEIITLGITENNTLQEYSIFEYAPYIHYTLPSKRFIIDPLSTTYSYYDVTDTDDQTYKKCTLYHNLDGIIDFTIRKVQRQSNIVYEELYDINHAIIDNNTIEFILNIAYKYEIVVWKIDQINYKNYKNVFLLEEFSPSGVDWNVYSNTEEFQLNLNYRFSLIGYMTTTNLPINIKDIQFEDKQHTNVYDILPSGVNELATNANIVNTLSRVERNYKYILNDTGDESVLTNKLTVLAPNFEDYDRLSATCKNIYMYTSILSQTIYINLQNASENNQNWYLDLTSNVVSIVLKHSLHGIVKCSIRNVRNDLYNTYNVYTQNVGYDTLKIVFPYNYKLVPQQMYVDLFLIWSEENAGQYLFI